MSEQPRDLSELISKQSKVPEDIDIDSDDLAIQKELKRLEAKRYSSDTSYRRWLAKWTAIVVSIWLTAVLLILLFNENHIHLANNVLMVLLGTTTLNVLGLSYIVLRGHFQAGGR